MKIKCGWWHVLMLLSRGLWATNSGPWTQPAEILDARHRTAGFLHAPAAKNASCDQGIKVMYRTAFQIQTTINQLHTALVSTVNSWAYALITWLTAIRPTVQQWYKPGACKKNNPKFRWFSSKTSRYGPDNFSLVFFSIKKAVEWYITCSGRSYTLRQA